jgi:hypothetical protein
MLAEFDRAQYQGFPNAGYSTVVAADWDGDGTSSFGLFYQDLNLFYRKDLGVEFGIVRQQLTDQVGSRVLPLTWRSGGSEGN